MLLSLAFHYLLTFSSNFNLICRCLYELLYGSTGTHFQYRSIWYGMIQSYSNIARFLYVILYEYEMLRTFHISYQMAAAY